MSLVDQNNIGGEEEEDIDEQVKQYVEMIATEEEEAASRSKRSRSTPESEKFSVWEHCTRIKNSDPPRASCDHCPQSFACHSTINGTSSMSKHLKYHCPFSPVRVKDETNDGKTQTKLSFKSNSNGGHDLVPVKFSQEACREAVAVMVILDEHSFKSVEGEGFLHFCSVAAPLFKVPSRTTVVRDCISLYLKEKKKLKSILETQNICITTDTWTSIQNINYMCVTAHYIDKNWRLTKKILIFFVVPDHKGETIGMMLEKSLISWGVDRFLTVTCDNASSNNTAIASLKSRTIHWENVMLDLEFVHVRCSAHILNLIVRCGLDEFDESVQRVRDVIRYVRSSPSRWAKWKKFVVEQKIGSKKNVCIDVATRWNSTYMMLERAEVFERAFVRMEADDVAFRKFFAEVNVEEEEEDEAEMIPPPKKMRNAKEKRKQVPPKHEDWARVRLFVQFLELYYKTTNKISGSNYVTSDLLFNELVMIHCNLKKLCDSLDDGLSRIGFRMYAKFKKYWRLDMINPLLLVAVVLDPRYKLGYFSFSLKKIYGNDTIKAKEIIDKVRDTLNRVYAWYHEKNSNSDGSSSSQSGSASAVTNNLETNDMEYDIASEWKRLNQSGNNGSMTEVDKYLDCSIEDEIQGRKFEILDWWKSNAMKYPILSHVARDILAIPVTSVASESAFSTGGRILDSFCSCLRPNTVEALICTQNWIRSGTRSIDLQAEMEEVEEYDAIDAEIFEKGLSALTLED